LSDYGKKIGLISDERYQKFTQKRNLINAELEYLKNEFITPNKEISLYFEEKGYSLPKGRVSLLEILKRPDITYDDLERIDKRQIILPEEAKEQVEINVKYAGYIEKSIKEAEKLKKENNIKIPNDIDYDKVHNLALEARAKLNKIRPLTISQATRISGVNPADIQMLLLYLKTYET